MANITAETKLSFIDKATNTRTGFAHRSELIADGSVVHSARVSYLNRTWEVYRFQTSRKLCVANLIDSITNTAAARYKRENNLRKLPKGWKDNFKATNESVLALSEFSKSL